MLALTLDTKVVPGVAVGEGVNDLPSLEPRGAIVAGELDRPLARLRRRGQPSRVSHPPQERLDRDRVLCGVGGRGQHEQNRDQHDSCWPPTVIGDLSLQCHGKSPLVNGPEIIRALQVSSPGANHAAGASHDSYGTRAGSRPQARDAIAELPLSEPTLAGTGARL